MSEQLFENWDETKSALLENLSGNKRKTVDTLMENQKNYLTESASAGSTEAHNIANLRKTLIPMIRRVIPGTIATEIVGVQAMSGPVAQVFTLRHQYEEAATGPAAGTDGNPFGLPAGIAQGDELFGNGSPVRSWYSGGIGADNAAGASGLTGAGNTEADIAAAGAHGGPAGSAQSAADASPDGFEAVTGGGTDQYGNAATLLPGHQGFVGNYRGGSGSYLEGTGGRKVTMRILSQVVEAQSRKLQAGWTLEAMQDMNSQHGLNIEDEMTRALSADIVQEIDQEIITDLLGLAGTVASFDGAGAGTYGANYTPAFLGDRFANLGVIINYVANEIARKTRRGEANFVVVSPMVVSILQSASKSVFAPAVEGSFKGPNNTMLAGTLNGRIKVYTYLFNQAGGADLFSADGGVTAPVGVDDSILVGYKGGDKETDAGYFYCPYVPLMSSGTVYNAVTHQPVMSVMTRYAKAVFTASETSLGNSSDYYGKINIDNMDFA